jgi:lipopolysaccharide/colanic/teichoic acid biosynthesis glycosyltransferase
LWFAALRRGLGRTTSAAVRHIFDGQFVTFYLLRAGPLASIQRSHDMMVLLLLLLLTCLVMVLVAVLVLPL